MTEYQFFLKFGIEEHIEVIRFYEDIIDQANRDIKEGVLNNTPTKKLTTKGELK